MNRHCWLIAFQAPRAHVFLGLMLMLAGMVGALTLARAVDDPALSKEILAVARKAFGQAHGNC